jgi:hypothetical protein
MAFIKSEVDKMLEPGGAAWDAVRQEPYALNEDLEREYDDIVIPPIRIRERVHMVRPRDIQQAAIQVQRRGLPTDQPLFETSETDIVDDSDLYDCPPRATTSSQVETSSVKPDYDCNRSVTLSDSLTIEDTNAQQGPRKRMRIVVDDDEDDE